MEFKEIKEKEFDKFAKTHEQANFSQTSAWADVKKVNGWNGLDTNSQSFVYTSFEEARNYCDHYLMTY